MDEQIEPRYLSDIVLDKFGVKLFFSPVLTSVGLIFQCLRHGTFIYIDSPVVFYIISTVLFLATCGYLLIVSHVLTKNAIIRDNEFAQIKQQMRLPLTRYYQYGWVLCLTI